MCKMSATGQLYTLLQDCSSSVAGTFTSTLGKTQPRNIAATDVLIRGLAHQFWCEGAVLGWRTGRLRPSQRCCSTGSVLALLTPRGRLSALGISRFAVGRCTSWKIRQGQACWDVRGAESCWALPAGKGSEGARAARDELLGCA